MKRSEDYNFEIRKDLEDKRTIIEDQDKLIKDLGNQLNQTNEEHEENLRKKQSEINILKKDKSYEDSKKKKRNGKTLELLRIRR